MQVRTGASKSLNKTQSAQPFFRADQWQQLCSILMDGQTAERAAILRRVYGGCWRLIGRRGGLITERGDAGASCSRPELSLAVQTPSAKLLGDARV